ncbi:SusC/RagA family TonB-linked outer membrane protein [Labilibaculum sp.]|uniref:SusC/RagA family TonB-linked outer membrane protein n=1 Tax=Labilibaculum sp. TaxID=2060723 RepID=UPI003563335B
MKKYYLRNFHSGLNNPVSFGRKIGSLALLIAIMALPIYASADVNKFSKENSEVAVQKTVTGTVNEDSGMSLPGVSVVVKGTTVGTVTDIDGKYTIAVDESDVLVFSFVGMTTQEIPVGAQSVIDVVMASDALQVDEVVVTALGIKREKKALGYSAQDVKAEDLMVTGDANVTSALSGKIAGVQISEMGGGAGANSRIEIRGTSSLTGSDGPLWVVDGVPFDSGNSSDAGIWSGTSRAGGSFDLNPEDIESISVLKGPNAAALYGERGGNGVIMVTTKKGTRSSGLGISYSGNVTISKAAYFLNMQDQYGQGNDGVYSMNATDSWGPLMEGQLLEAWTGETIAYEAQDDRIEDFARTGVSQNHNISLSGGNDEGSFRASIGKNIIKGIYEGNKVTKLTFDSKADYDINNWLNVDTKISYFRTEGDERPQLGQYSALYYYYNMPMNIRNQDLSPGYEIIDGEHVETLYTTANANYRNPYFLLAQRTNEDQKDRLFGYVAANLSLAKGLTAKLKYGLDTYRFGNTSGTLYADNVSTTNPTYNTSEKYFKEENYEYLITYAKEISEDFSFDASFGGSNMNQYYETLSASSGELASEADYFLGNGTDISATESFNESEVRSLYGFINASYKNMLFLDITGRKDWSSTLTASSGDYDNSYFYPSVGLSGLVSEMIEMPEWISFAKVRGSMAKLGKSADPYQTSTDYTVSSGKFNLLVSEQPDEQVIQDLKPEMSTSYEVGLDLRLFKGRINLDATYYYERTKNQILDVENAYTTGYTSSVVNAGLITNEGLEVLLSTIPIKTKDFQLGVDFNIAMNKGVMKELTDDLTEYEFGNFNGGTEVMGIVGEKMGVIRGSKYVRDDNGDIVVGSDGLPTYQESQVLGNVQADLTGSIGFNANYKGVYVSALFSGQIGGDIVSVTEAAATSSGNSKRTTAMGRIDMFAPGVLADGGSNTTIVSAQEYWGTVSNIDEEFIYDASYLKLKELAIGYNIPKSFLERFPSNPISSVRLSLVGRNLFYLHKNTPGTVPDAGAYSSGYFAKAFDFSSVPSTRTFGFSLNVKF